MEGLNPRRVSGYIAKATAQRYKKEETIMKKMAVLAAALMLAASATHALTVTYGWEDGGTVLGVYGTALASNVSSPVNTGTKSLKLVDNSSGSGTPQAYVAWIKGLADGDVVTAGFWRYDTTIGSSPSTRIWAHWNDSPTDVMGYAGSAGGNSDYGTTSGWQELSWSWTVSGGHTGLVIEARTYSDGQDTVWIDDLSVTAPDTATIVTPAVPEPGALLALMSGIVGLFGFVRRRS